MFFVFDNTEKLIRIIKKSGVKSAEVSEYINLPRQLDALFSDVKALENANYIAHKDLYNPALLCLYRITNTALTSYGLEVTAIDSAYDDLLADGYIVDQRPSNKTVTETLTQVLDGSRWSVGTVNTTPTVTTNFYYISRLDALYKIMDVPGCEFQTRVTFSGNSITGRYIDVYDRIGSNRGKRFVYGSNLLEVIHEEKHSDIYTALIGRGKGEQIIDEYGDPTDAYGRRILFSDVVWTKAGGDPVDKPLGQIYVEIPEMTALFGYPDGKPRIGIVEFGDIEDAEELLDATYNELIERSRPMAYFKTQV